MSAPLIKSDVKFFQRLLKVAGFYPYSADGIWGKKTQKGSDDWDAEFRRIRHLYGEFDSRTEGVIATLLPKAQVKAREFMDLAKDFGDVRLLSGTRTYAEQNALFAKKPKVTNAKGGQSNHNFGIAWDVGIFIKGKYATGATKAEMKAYRDLATVVKESIQGIEWGGDWKSFPDAPHYQLVTGKTTAQVRAALEGGKAYV